MKKYFYAAICVAFISQIGISKVDHKKNKKDDNNQNIEYIQQIHEIGLDYETTQILLSQLHKNEMDYQEAISQLVEFFKESSKKLSLNPKEASRLITKEIKKQKKLLEKKLKRSHSDIKRQIKAFKDFNRFLIVTLNRSEYQEIIHHQRKFYQNLFRIKQKYTEEIKDNQLEHTFWDKSEIDFQNEGIFKAISNIQRQLQKIRCLIRNNPREKEIFNKEYHGMKGTFRKIKDKFNRVGQYS